MISLTKKRLFNHVVEYFPKEKQMTKLLPEYSDDLFSSDFYDHITNKQINSFNKSKPVENPLYTFWPVINNGYQQMTENENDSTIENQNKTLVHEQSLDSGKDIMHLRSISVLPSFRANSWQHYSGSSLQTAELNRAATMPGRSPPTLCPTVLFL